MNEEEPSPLSEGLFLDDRRYELVRQIGKGEQAEIWLIRDLGFLEKRLVAKLWYSRWDQRSEHKFQERNRRLNQEAKLLSQIESSYTVVPHFRISANECIAGVDHIILGVAMDLASEGSLDQYLANNRGLTTLQRVRLLEQLANGLADLQQAEVVHNDIKPGNILVFKSGDGVVPKFGDFGLAFQQGSGSSGGGTILYMAPELINEFGRPSFSAAPSTKTDIFSLGIVFYEILQGVHPFAALIGGGDAEKVLAGYFPTHETLDFDQSRIPIDPELASIVQRMCSRDPDNRPSIFEICEELAEIAFRIRGREPLQFVTEFPDAVGRYRWSDAVHKAFNEHEQLIFLRGSHIDRDPDYLARALTNRRLYGFSIFRLLGSRDYLLRVWRRESDRNALSEVLQGFETERSGQAEVFDPVLRWPGTPLKSKLPLARQGDMLKFINTFVSDQSDAGVREAQKLGLILGRTKTDRENAPPGGKRRTSSRKAIRAICRVTHAREIRIERATVVGEHIFHALQTPGVRELEVFVNPGAQGKFAEFVVIAELDHFHNYRQLLMELGNVLSTFLSETQTLNQFRFRSHFEMDETSKYECYDGRIFFELYRGRRRGVATERGHET